MTTGDLSGVDAYQERGESPRSGHPTPDPIRYIDMHRSPRRREYFATGTRGIAYDAALRRWIVDQPTLITKVLTDPGFSVSDYAGVCRHMAESGKAVVNLAFAYENIPLCRDGEAHRRLRRSMSEHLAVKRRNLAETLPQIVEKHLEPVTRPGPVEVMSAALIPMIDEIIYQVVDTEFEEKGALESISSAFDRLMGPRKLIGVDEQIGKLRARIREMHGALATEAEGRLLALLMLGRDPLLATIGESLRHVFFRCDGRRTAEMTFPSAPPETGVPYIERQANRDCQLGNESIRKGDRLRVLLQAYAYSEEERDKLKIFGTGIHACLGRPLALDIWREVVTCLTRLNVRLAFRGAAPRKTDYVFTCPAFLSIEVLP